MNPPGLADSEEIEPTDRKKLTPQKLSVSSRGMVSAAHPGATEAGARMLALGGNAVDAAVATAFALGVCEPHASGLGGQTMMTIHLKEQRKTFSLDGSSRAPWRLIPGKFKKSQLLIGHTASTVPSTPAALEYALHTYGTLSLKEVMAPAIRLAERGFAVSELQYFLTKRELRKLKKSTAAPFFLRNGKTPYKPGQILKQPVLAETLRRIARHGVKTFYQGRIAREIARDMKANGGLIRRDDLAQIPWPLERKPVTGRFGPLRVMTMPPPGAGRTLLEMLNIIGRLPERLHNPDTPKGAAAITEVIRQCNLDRNDRPFDPNYFPQVDYQKALTGTYADRTARRIRRKIKTTGETTHLSVMDESGNAVALTQSIERVYGSFAASPALGFLYNNYMSAFEYEDITHPYYLRPGAAPWASVAPSIIYRGKKPWMVIGSPGSERIASSILQVLLRLERLSPLEAVSAPRLHCSLDGKVALEATRMRDDIPHYLARMGYEIVEKEPYSFYLGCVQMVMREGKKFIGVADPRRDGSAQGPRRL